MKLTDDLVNKYGTDKLLHLAFGGWFVALFSIINFWCGLAAIVVLLALSVLKETKLDKFADWMDVTFAMGGGTVSFLVALIKILV